MPSESVAGFFDQAQASRVLFPEQIEQLIRQPDIPQSNLDSLCEYLLARGVLTRFQAAAIRESRGAELNYGGYPVIDDLGPCPGGRAYKALHPSLRTPILLRRIRFDWFGPSDTPEAFVARARAFGMLPHPNLVHLLDAGIYAGEVFVVIDTPSDAADLETLAKEVGGAMPGFLAAEYGRAIASVLRMAHERGGYHGDVRPANIVVGPLTVKTTADGRTKRRPAPDAVVRLAELGLVPIRPPATQSPPDVTALPYLPPERLDASCYEPRGDIYSLGATLYFFLAGRPPVVAETPDEMLAKVRSTTPTPLKSLRPDLPADYAAAVMRMLEKPPENRLATAAEAEHILGQFCRPGSVPPTPVLVPMASPTNSYGVSPPMAQAVAASEVPSYEAVSDPPEPAAIWGVDPGPFTSSVAESADATPRRREMTASEKNRNRLLFILGGLLHLTGITLLILWLTGAFNRSPSPSDYGPDINPARPQSKDLDDKPKSKVNRK
jgi:serine/threonine protein kinase